MLLNAELSRTSEVYYAPISIIAIYMAIAIVLQYPSSKNQMPTAPHARRRPLAAVALFVSLNLLLAIAFFPSWISRNNNIPCVPSAEFLNSVPIGFGLRSIHDRLGRPPVPVVRGHTLINHNDFTNVDCPLSICIELINSSTKRIPWIQKIFF